MFKKSLSKCWYLFQLNFVIIFKWLDIINNESNFNQCLIENRQFKMILKLLLICLINYGHGANILGIYFHAGKSHHILGEMLLKELATRGHNVTMASPFPLNEPFPNYTDIHLTGILEDQIGKEYFF